MSKEIPIDVLRYLAAAEKKTVLGKACRELVARREADQPVVSTDPFTVRLPVITYPDQPVRMRFNGRDARMRDCGHCGKTEQTVFDSDETPTCAACADAAHLQEWINYGEKMRNLIAGIYREVGGAA